MDKSALWRPMTAADLVEVERIAAIVHPAYPEAGVVLAEKHALAGPSCFVLTRGSEVVGYAIGHPWSLGRPPALNTLLGALPEAADTLHVHDIALLPEARGRGAAGRAVELLAGMGWPSLSLVAVSGTEAIWARLGFAAVEGDVASYGRGARYMVRWAGGRVD